MRHSLKLTPATGVALVALFLALGGSAFAIGTKVAPQQRCAQGAVRGIAVVQGDTQKGIANMPDQFSSSPSLFARRFNCTGGAVQVRRVNTGVFEVKFVGNPAPTALASALAQDGSSAAVARLGDGTFQVSTRGGTANQNSFVLNDTGFTLIVF